MANGTIHKLGTLYVNGSKIKRPKYPWVNGGNPNGAPSVGDIFEYSGSGNIEIRNTDSDDAYKLQWIEVNDKGKRLLICDRNILSRVSWDDLNVQGFVNGKKITIDGQEYKIRLLSGGSNYRSGSDSYSGGSPTDNEWDRIIVNEGNFSELPIPSSTDLDSSLNSTDYSSEHNKVWNWAGMFSWCKEVYSGSSDTRVARGCNSARCFNYGSSDNRGNLVGWRPVLEIPNSVPTISDSDRDFGDFASPFIKTYTITDSDNDKMKVVEKINGDIIRTLENQTSGTELTLDLTSKWKDLSIGKHIITIEVDDGIGGVATRKWTFTKTNSNPEKPTILYPKNNMRTKEEFYVRFTVGKDAEGDAQEVKIQLADDNKFSSNLKEFAEGLEKNVGGSWISHSGDITDADIGNEFRISVKATKNTTKYIRVATKDKTSGATEFSDAEEVKIGDKLKFETIQQTFDFKPYAISIVDKKEVDSNATIRVYACNNALDTDKTWEDITEEYLKDNYYPFKNNKKENDSWAVSIKYEIEANNSIGEISIDAIGIGVS